MFDLETMTPDQLVDELTAQAARIDAGLARLVALAGECERRVAWAGEGTTFAAWLAWQCSILPRQVREHERVAGQLSELPLIRGAFERGELSYAKVCVLTRIAEPDSEEGLLELAEVLTASQLDRAVGAYRRLTREEAAEQHEREFFHYFWDEDGSLSLCGRLPGDEGVLLLRALEAARESLRARRHVEGVDPARATNAEALVAVAELALASPDGDRSGGERYQVHVHVDARVLAADDDGRCELDDGQPLAAETARRLACDSALVGDDGRKRRTVSAPLRRVLTARDRGCRFPGCERTRFVDAHHVEHWSRGGETTLDNLLSLCRRHHRLVHEGGYSVEFLDDGEAQFTNRHGIVVASVPRPPPSDPDALRRQHESEGIEIDAATARIGDGERAHFADLVDAVFATAGR
jgi:hypothetical protein